ncbi:flagellar basal body rod protein FlgB [Chrysiogenes arsenatis]|uniref:flagellar basal body rod protein FlgB n=1 Tax=Chrysiogenes arsenatis TaxID=309797 RepID=UPI0004806CAE|nr:flagellar basal body rod protein FlgB [Chrysiogenes arsenatis]
MFINSMFSRGTIPILSTVMDLRSRNQDIISSNIANAETPNYKAKKLVFEDQLREAVFGSKADKELMPMAKTHPDHLPDNGLIPFVPYIDLQNNQTVRNDGNDVELEKEMGNMIENSMMFNAASQIVAKKIEGLKNAIREGK